MAISAERLEALKASRAQRIKKARSMAAEKVPLGRKSGGTTAAADYRTSLTPGAGVVITDAQAVQNCQSFVQRVMGYSVECTGVSKDPGFGYGFIFNSEQAARAFAEDIYSVDIKSAEGSRKTPYRRSDGSFSISIEPPELKKLKNVQPPIDRFVDQEVLEVVKARFHCEVVDLRNPSAVKQDRGFGFAFESAREAEEFSKSLESVVGTQKTPYYNPNDKKFYISIDPEYLVLLTTIIEQPYVSNLESQRKDSGVSQVDSSENNLQHYLKAPIIPEGVRKLAQTGKGKYDSGVVQAKKWATQSPSVDRVRSKSRRVQDQTWDLPSAGAGRSDDWVDKTYEQSEDSICEDLKKLDPPKSVTVSEISGALEHSTETGLVADAPPHFTIVQGVGANDLHRTPLGNNAVYQIASQFNYLESPSENIVPVGDYLYDRTQGPQASIEAGAAALHRRAAVEAGKLDHAPVDLLPENLKNKRGLYLNGYLDTTVLNEAEKRQLLGFMQSNVAKLRILPQWAMCESSGAMQLQVFCAAPSFQSTEQPTEGSIDHKICELLVVEQYAATARLAVLRSRETGERVPLHLTLVGQGAFNNNPVVMQKAIEAVAEIVQGEGVDVYFHAYDPKAQAILENQMSNGIREKLFTFSEMSREEFKNKAHPTAAISEAKAPQEAISDSQIRTEEQALQEKSVKTLQEQHQTRVKTETEKRDAQVKPEKKQTVESHAPYPETRKTTQEPETAEDVEHTRVTQARQVAEKQKAEEEKQKKEAIERSRVEQEQPKIDRKKSDQEAYAQTRRSTSVEKIPPSIQSFLGQYPDGESFKAQYYSNRKTFLKTLFSLTHQGRSSRKDQIDRLSKAINVVREQKSKESLLSLQEILRTVQNEIQLEKKESRYKLGGYKLGDSALEKMCTQLSEKLSMALTDEASNARPKQNRD